MTACCSLCRFKFKIFGIHFCLERTGEITGRHWQSSLYQCRATYSGMSPSFLEAPLETHHPCATLGLGGFSLSLGHHHRPVRQGRPYQLLSYCRHSSLDPLTTQALPLLQSGDTVGREPWLKNWLL
jgi:hypothetical protein